MWERRGRLRWTWRTSHGNLQCSFCHERKASPGSLLLFPQKLGEIPACHTKPPPFESTAILSGRFNAVVTLSAIPILFQVVLYPKSQMPWVSFCGRSGALCLRGDDWRVQAVLLSCVELTAQVKQWNPTETCDLGSVTGLVQSILTEEQLAHSAWKKNCPDEALIICLTDTTFKISFPLEFVINSYSVD